MTKAALRIAITVALTVLLASCGGDNEQTHQKTGQQNPANIAYQKAASSMAVSFETYDVDGVLRQSSEWVGKQPVVINVWGTWCPPCRKEIPALVRLYDEYRFKGVEILGLAVQDPPQRVAAFARQYGIEWVMMMGSRSIMRALGATSGVPTTIFLDREGHEVARFVGSRGYREFKSAFEAIL